MGTPKQVLPFGDTTMVGAVIRAARASHAADVIVVTGFHRDEVEAVVGSSVCVVRNPAPETGNMSSLLVGLEAAGDVDGVVVLVSDMPRVSSSAIDALIDGVSGREAYAGWVEYTDGRGHPIALAGKAFEKVRRLSGPKALWPYLDSLDDDDVFVRKVTDSRPIDVNTPQDYDRLTHPPREHDSIQN